MAQEQQDINSTELMYTKSDIDSQIYTHTQVAPLTTWNIAHNLCKFPSVTITTNIGEVVMADVLFVDMNNITIEFRLPFNGIAYLN